MVPMPAAADHRQLPEARAHDPVVQRYRACFALLDWHRVRERGARRAWRGTPPHPPAASIKALLVKRCEHQAYITELRTFLVGHPLLVLELGFRPVLDPTQPYGSAVERTVPCDRYLRHWQQTLDPALLQALLRATVQAVQAELPRLGHHGGSRRQARLRSSTTRSPRPPPFRSAIGARTAREPGCGARRVGSTPVSGHDQSTRRRHLSASCHAASMGLK